MKSGTAEQEQNGVNTPKTHCHNVAHPFALASQQGAGALGRKKLRTTPIGKDDKRQKHHHLGHIIEEKRDGLPGVAVAVHRERRGNPFGTRG